jgi:dTMP kinase
MATFLAEFSADDIAMFISFEGGEGAGKSTQLRRLGAAFERAGLPVITTREPGGCDSAEQIRALLVSGDPDRWRPQTEALLMMAARSEHLERTIKPALDAQKWVLCDRFFDSTLVYQGHAKGLGEDACFSARCCPHSPVTSTSTPPLALPAPIAATGAKRVLRDCRWRSISR